MEALLWFCVESLLFGWKQHLAVADGGLPHLEVENCLHWTLDMVFDEDRSRVRKDLVPAKLAILHKLSLNAIKSEPTKMGVQSKRNAGWDSAFPLRLMRHVG